MRATRLAALTAALLVLPATAAWGHPSLNPNAVPVGEPVETTVVVPHGCSTGEGVMPEGEGEAVPTTRFDLQVVDGMTIEPGEVDGWDTEVQDDAVVWTDAGGATTDPIELPITLTVASGEPGDQLALSAFQECENGDSYRWTEGSEDTPPVRVELTEGEAGTVEMDHEDMGHGSESEMDHGDGTEHASEDMSDMSDTETADEVAAEPAGEPRASSFSTMTVLLVVAVLGLGIAGGILLARRRGTS